MQDNKIVKYSGHALIKQVGSAIDTTKRLLAIAESNGVKTFLISNPALSIKFLSRYFPFSKELLKKFVDLVDWELLSMNEQMKWDEEIIEKYSPMWTWDILCRNGGVPWNGELLGKYKDKVDWKELSANPNFPTMQTISEYDDWWDWKTLSSNERLNWSAELVDMFEHKWNWVCLSQNKGLPWSVSFIKKFNKRFYWNCVSRVGNFSDEMLRDLHDYIYWTSLGWNNSLKWTEELANHVATRGNVMGFMFSFPLSEELLQEYALREPGVWQLLSLNIQLHWTDDLVNRYAHKWDWEALTYNPAVPWSLSLLNKYKDRLRYSFMNENIWPRMEGHRVMWEKVFKNHVDESMVEEVLNHPGFEALRYNWCWQLDRVMSKIDFIYEQSRCSEISRPNYAYMFSFLGYHDVFEVLKLLEKVLNCYTFWLSGEMTSVLRDIQALLLPHCVNSVKDHKELKQIGIKLKQPLQSLHEKLENVLFKDSSLQASEIPLKKAIRAFK